MDNGEIFSTICGVSVGIVFFSLFLLMFVQAIRRGKLVFHGGIIYGWPARVVGVIGLLGIVSCLYLILGYEVFHTELPCTPVAIFLMCLASFILLALKFTSVFWRRRK